MKCIRFSIIVPVYNVEPYLKKCLDSLIFQTYPDIEIIIVDDGSTDRCPQICDEYAEKDSRVRVFHKKNGGLSDARNFGMKKAEGEYIVFVDSDDYIKEESCETFDRMLLANPDVDIIAANICRVGTLSPIAEMYLQTNYVFNGRDFLKFQLNNKTMYVSACRNIYRRDFLSENNLIFKTGIFHEDEEWTPRVFLQAHAVICTDYVFYYHFIRGGSITQQKQLKHATDIIFICDTLKLQYMDLKDHELRILLMDYLVTLYLHAFYNGKLLGSKYKNTIDKVLLKKMAASKKNKRKAAFFCFNRNLYYVYCFMNHNGINFLKRKLKQSLRSLHKCK